MKSDSDAADDVAEDAPADDHDLLEDARLGSRTAVAELWRRHRPAAHRYAASLTRRFDADDLVSEAFTRVFATLRRGGGPTDALRPYLFVTIRNVAITWSKAPESRSLDDTDDLSYEQEMDRGLIQSIDRDALERALALLPEQWRRILWATEIEGKRPAELSSTLGVQPNSVAALAYRAREALKHAWVQVHVPAEQGEGEHRWVRERTGRYVHHALTPRQMERFRTHIRACPPCDEIVGGAKRLAVLPVGLAALALSLGLEVAPHGATTPPAAAASLPRLSARVRSTARRIPTRALTIAGAACVAAGVVVASAMFPTSHPADAEMPQAAALPPSIASAPASTEPAPEPEQSESAAPALPDSSSGGSPDHGGTRSESSPVAATPLARTTAADDQPEGPSVESASSSPGTSAGDPTSTPTAMPSTTATPSWTSTFTVSTVAPGSSGIAVVEVRNDGEPVRQRADSVHGSFLTVHAPAGTTFIPRSTLRNDYMAADSPRSESALEIDDCTVDDDLRTLVCAIDARDTLRTADRSWVWRSGDSRVLYLDLAVDRDAPTGTTIGATQIHLMTNDHEERVLDGGFTVDIAAPDAPPAPAVRTIDPTGTDLLLAGTASPRCRVSIDVDGRELASVLVEDDGRWSATVPWQARGTFEADAKCDSPPAQG